MGTANRIDLTLARFSTEEGTRLLPYDDATGLPVKAPVGKLTWGRGFNLEACGSKGLFDVMERYLLQQIDSQICGFMWYRSADETRKSVFLDVAYNSGVAGLRDFDHMLSAASVGDWETAAAQCHVKNPKLAKRYEHLAELLRVGDTQQ